MMSTWTKRYSAAIGLAAVAIMSGATGCSELMHPYNELFDGRTLEGWTGLGRADVGEWLVADDVELNPATEGKTFVIEPGKGIMVNGPQGRTCDLVTTTEQGDCEAHIEFVVSKGSNSGVYFMGKYEIQILDSYGKTDFTSHDCGGIYERWIDGKGYDGVPPRVNASRPAGEWQTFEVIFRAPRFDEGGKKIENARFVEVKHNGLVIHKDVELKGPTRGAMKADEEKPTGPLRLQGDHGPVAYRNIKIRSIKD